jgi:hypothetical protein
MDVQKRIKAIETKMASDKSEKTFFNAGRRLACELVSTGQSVTELRAYVNQHIKNEEYQNGALAELEMWT